MAQDIFVDRHLGPRAHDVNEMLDVIGESSVQALIDKTIPAAIRLKEELKVGDAYTEQAFLEHMQDLGSKNQVFKSYIGLGYHPTVIPPAIQRNVLENPGWYTAYTPYQAEIAQGRLEALLNFQTVVMDLTGMQIANASLLDEGTAAAEAMIMFYNTRKRDAVKAGVVKFFVSETCYPQNIDIMRTRAEALDIELVIGNHNEFTIDATFFGACIQYPDSEGRISDYRAFTDACHAVNAKVAVAADLMSLVLITAPGEWNADVVFGNTQRFGVPMGYGGPHAAYFATKEDYKRHIPGRIIGVSIDRHGNRALRMALQTREQHIRRDKATSNICTAQALLAVMASMYAVYHGPKGLTDIAQRIHRRASQLADALSTAGLTVVSDEFFDTVTITGVDIDAVRKVSQAAGMNFWYGNNNVSISCNETTNQSDIDAILAAIGKATGKTGVRGSGSDVIAEARTTTFLQDDVFNSYHSETDLMRYLKRLENKDLSLVHSMIALGSCTMKLNAAAELMPITWPAFANMHPYCPTTQAQGYQDLINELDKDLSNITGFAKVSMQPNSGAQGEYAGLMVIRAYHHSRGDMDRKICLIPSSAHGTNPASAVMAGMKVVVTKCDEEGNIDVDDLRAKAELHKDHLSCLMVTYPSTHGVYESAIMEITQIIHDNGGQVYMDGANMNAQVGLTNPGNIGADVCHLNLHKTFAIPHGGGGPGVGPIGVAAHLAEFLPGSSIVKSGGENAISAISSAPWGSALILIISYGYVKMLGSYGLRKSTETAILNANYIRTRLSTEYDILYTGENGTVAHEMIVDMRGFKKTSGVEVEDIAKRLIDYGFHAPTVSFPVAGTLMIEPTESESKAELDKFCDAMLQIRNEIKDIENGDISDTDNLLKNAPHTVEELTASEWTHPYSREEASYPISYLHSFKFWAPVARVDNAHGDRNLICSCTPIEAYAEETVN